MLLYVKGNLFESPAHVLVNTVNTVGIMGRGIAKTFKSIFPDMFKKYQQLCEEKKIVVGKLWLFKTPNKWILNFPTKIKWQESSKIEFIESGLQTFVDNYADLGITSIAFPPLGCGNGSLNWEKQVQPLMEKYLKNLPIDVFIYLYNDNDEVPEHINIKEVKKWLRSEPRSLGFSEVWEDLKEIIGSGLKLNTKIFRTEVEYRLNSDHKESIRIEIKLNNDNNSNKSIFIYYEELIEIWSIIRNYGFITHKIMPYNYGKCFDEIITLFLKLPYCEEVIISKKYSDLDKSFIGLQLNELNLPEAEIPQLELQF
jgi:O-acetyl-ADP-ribose deacetylase (regulator of RNase III)